MLSQNEHMASLEIQRNWTIRWVIALLAFSVVTLFLGERNPIWIFSFFLLQRHDLLLILILVHILLIRWMQKPVPVPLPLWVPAAHYKAGVLILLFLGTWAGHYGVFAGYDISRDERMAEFGAMVYSAGRLYFEVPELWQGHLRALNTMFSAVLPGEVGWNSGYLPVNSALRALAAKLGDPEITGPVMVCIALASLWSVARRLWPEDPRVVLFVTMMFLGSGQIVFTAMTAFAMTAHLAFNLLWLALFLRGDGKGTVAALGVGFLATGLHQAVFHPLFVAPFLWLLMQRREWRRLAVFCLGYAVILSFWFAWPRLAVLYSGIALPEVASASAVSASAVAVAVGGWQSYIASIPPLQLFLQPIETLSTMADNLLRAFTWNHFLLVPLIGLALRLFWRTDPMVRALAVGLMLPILLATLVIPWQGHGWGYRYIHQVLGNAILLAGFAFAWLLAQGFVSARGLGLAAALGIGLVMPVQAWLVRDMLGRFSEVDRAISAIDADIAVIDDPATPFGSDFVFNRPDLSNRPLRVQLTQVSMVRLIEICQGESVVVVGAEQFEPVRDYFFVTGAGLRDPSWSLKIALAGCVRHKLTLPSDGREAANPSP